MKAEKCYLHSQNFVEVFFKKGGGVELKKKCGKNRGILMFFYPEFL